jgi:heat shock protein HtpX
MIADFHATTGDWRAQLKRNARKTRWVIALFIFIYLFVGLIVDVSLLQSHAQYKLTLGQSLYAFLTFKLFPYATFIMGIIAVVSLLITYSMYDKIMLLGTDYREITATSALNLKEKQLYNVIEEMKTAAGLKFMPKVFIINADYMNAFASGFSEKSAMVAITRGLMEKLDRAEMQAVMAHELSHIRHNDIKLTLTVAVLSNIMLIAIDFLFYSFLFSRDERREDNRLLMVIVILRYVLPLVTVILTLFLSRTREYMADAGAVELMRDNEPMARALLKIHEDNAMHAEQYSQEYSKTPHEEIRQAAYLFDSTNLDAIKALNTLFSTHPNLRDRLSALGFKARK